MVGEDLQEAKRRYEQSLKLRKALLKANPAGATGLQALFFSYSRLGAVAMAGGDLKDAKRRYEQSFVPAKTLVEADPTCATAHKYMLLSHIMLWVFGSTMNHAILMEKHQSAIIRLLTMFMDRGWFGGDALIKKIRALMAR